MDVPRGRPATAGEYSRRLDHVENDEPESRRPAPPSTYRSGKSPRTENMLATTERNTSHGAEKFADGTASELALLRTKVEEGELAKANAQVYEWLKSRSFSRPMRWREKNDVHQRKMSYFRRNYKP